MQTFTRDGLTFEVTDSGPSDGAVVVLLHGFPQDRHAWDLVIPLLNERGLRTLAPDQRGYSPAASPRGRGAYRMRELVADVLALADAAGARRFHLVGHDWGGAVAWALAASAPQRVESLVVLSTPHPQALIWAATHTDQWRKSLYMLAFQVPRLAERRTHAMLPKIYRSTGLDQQTADRYARRFPTPESLTAPMNWYRALATLDLPASLRPRRNSPAPSKVTVPTTFVWGERDFALGEASATRTAQHVQGDYRFVRVDEGHWLPELAPQAVADQILARALGQAAGQDG
ncbi:alpha/beta fold hydrolase [Dermacoccaceae bacterium W4C1]